MKNYLLRKNIAVKKFASELGISTSYLYQLLRGERKPSLDLAYRIEKYTGGEVMAKELLDMDIQFICSPNQENHREQFTNQFANLEERISRLEKRLCHIETRK